MLFAFLYFELYVQYRCKECIECKHCIIQKRTCIVLAHCQNELHERCTVYSTVVQYKPLPPSSLISLQKNFFLHYYCTVQVAFGTKSFPPLGLDIIERNLVFQSPPSYVICFSKKNFISRMMVRHFVQLLPSRRDKSNKFFLKKRWLLSKTGEPFY